MGRFWQNEPKNRRMGHSGQAPQHISPINKDLPSSAKIRSWQNEPKLIRISTKTMPLRCQCNDELLWELSHQPFASRRSPFIQNDRDACDVIGLGCTLRELHHAFDDVLHQTARRLAAHLEDCPYLPAFGATGGGTTGLDLSRTTPRACRNDGAAAPVVCGGSGHQGQIGFGRPGATARLRSG